MSGPVDLAGQRYRIMLGRYAGREGVILGSVIEHPDWWCLDIGGGEIIDVTFAELTGACMRRLDVETIDLRVEGAAEIAAASEALSTVDEHVREALCAVLDRLGADGACAFMRGDSPEQVSDAIFVFVREEEEILRRDRDALRRGLAEALGWWSVYMDFGLIDGLDVSRRSERESMVKVRALLPAVKP